MASGFQLAAGVWHKGTAGGGQATYGNFVTQGFSNATVTANTMFASPVIVPNQIFVLAFGFGLNAQAVGASSSSMAIYQNTNDYTLYPSTLVPNATTGTINTLTQGTGIVVVNAATNATTGESLLILDPGLYWFVHWSNTAATTQPKFTTVTAGSVIPVLGVEGTFTGNMQLTVANTWAATFPTNFPTGAAYSTSVPFLGLIQPQK